MLRYLRFLVPLGAFSLVASAHAIDFGTTAFINGTAYTINAINSPIQQLGNSLSFAIPSGVVLSGSKTITLQYGVSATPGNYIATATEFATGQTVTTGTANFSTTFTSGATVETSAQNNAGGTAYSPYTHTFSAHLATWNPVATTINLASNGGIAKATAFTANYTEQPVPEPMTLGALGVGLVGLIARRRKN